MAAGTSTSGPAELPELCWKQSTPACSNDTASNETGDLVDTYARSAFEDTRRKAEKYGARGTTVKAYKPAS